MAQFAIAICIILFLISRFPDGQEARGETSVSSPAQAESEKERTVVATLEIAPFTSKIFHNTRMLRVWLPPSYSSADNVQRSYPVLYLQDGQNLFDEVANHAGKWHVNTTVDQLVASSQIPPMIVVGIDYPGQERSSEYLPYPDPHHKQHDVPVPRQFRGKDYATFLLTEVMPFIGSKYRVARGTANTGIGGASYGAVISLYTALQYPSVFGQVLLQSPVLGVGDGQLLKDAENATQLPQKMYLGMGTQETKDPEYNAQLMASAEELQAILRRKGLGADRLKVVVEQGAGHNEGAWSRRLPQALIFLYAR